MTAEESLQHHFSSLNLSDSASQLLLMVWEIFQFFDDVADGDEISRDTFDSVLWNCLVGLNGNQFYQSNFAMLSPLVANSILKWQASDIAERNGNASAMSYSWRASYYDIVLMVVNLTHGVKDTIKISEIVMSLYGETFSDYIEEFGNA